MPIDYTSSAILLEKVDEGHQQIPTFPIPNKQKKRKASKEKQNKMKKKKQEKNMNKRREREREKKGWMEELEKQKAK